MCIELGIDKQFKQVLVRVVCPTCNGKRFHLHDDEVEGIVPRGCTMCEGSGTVERWIDVKELLKEYIKACA